jgi:hypothetical protein
MLYHQSSVSNPQRGVSARSTIRKARFAIRRPFVESLILSDLADNASPSYFFVIFDMLLKGRMLALACV